ncbi:conserved hypothetical protein [Leishmania mexicana MHOM/GT/2001/U1103]|uniref:EF-hand domain-containing protein n=1 Tax=Leishmania mexicana (strain MHOM/GT/2001/U1103) TaxID=929439 RepID=E9ALN1_LEIMU|nr:conserved hypothetical protein [Leishmania mexicana MHOM/GT/2001/U1103]CBZ23836.1 conserved hypothetical protein [Leishmania mexicana MHOM/GT/2001/U1103]
MSLASSSSLPPIALATQRLRTFAVQEERAHELTTSTALEEWAAQSFEAETERINRELVQRRAQASATFLPALYMRGRDPVADETTRLLHSTCKAFELDLRFKEIEKLDEMHAHLWTLLSAGDRTSISMEAYEQLLHDFNEWAAERYGAQLPPPSSTVWDVSEDEDECILRRREGKQDDHERSGGGTSSPSMAPLSPPVSPGQPLSASTPPVSAATTASNDAPGNSGTQGASWGAVLQHVKRYRDQQRSDTPVSASSFMRSHAHFEHLLRLAEDQPALGNVLYLCSVPPPRPDVQLFLSCPRNAERAVEIAAIYQTFAKQVSLVKCEAELIMWDSNNDGRLSEDEVENYVRDLAPRIAALQAIGTDMLPFYCCTVSRRLFWDLDPGNRGVLRIHSLLHSGVMDEWVSLQLMTEDDPQNWFGALVTQQLYNKFVLLDTRNTGTLNVENLRGYKKGLPTVLDDGLPPDVSPLCSLFIDRYFETNTLMTRSEMDYRKFVDFVIAVELLPQCSRPYFFWNILDMEGTGVLTPMIVNQFFRETHAKLVAAGLDVPSRETVVQEVFDLIEKAESLLITRDEFVRSPQAGLFVALLIDCLSFWTYENREQR